MDKAELKSLKEAFKVAKLLLKEADKEVRQAEKVLRVACKTKVQAADAVNKIELKFPPPAV